MAKQAKAIEKKPPNHARKPSTKARAAKKAWKRGNFNFKSNCIAVVDKG
jgi:hypothetical protein